MDNTIEKPEGVTPPDIEVKAEIAENMTVPPEALKPTCRQIRKGFYGDGDASVVIKQHMLAQRHGGF